MSRPVILLYHRIADPVTDAYGLSVSPDDFRAQMAHLCATCRPMALTELLIAVRDGRMPERAVAVTLDDGYVDNFLAASPILTALGVPATFFVTTHSLDEEYEYWWDALERIFLSPGPPLPSALHLDLPDGPRSFQTDTRKRLMDAHRAVHQGILKSPAGVHEATIDALTSWSGRFRVRGCEHRRMLAAEVVEMARRAGHSIGSHSVRHLMLPEQPPEVQMLEIQESRMHLETLLGAHVNAFAYPFGTTSRTTADYARAAFQIAVTCEQMPVPRDFDPWRVPRIEVTRIRTNGFDEGIHGLLEPAPSPR